MDPAATPLAGTASPAPDSAPEEAIRRCLACHGAKLLRRAYGLICRTGLAQGNAALEMAKEVVQDLAVEGIDHAARLIPGKSPLSWLMGIMTNLLKQRRDELYRRARRSYTRAGSAEEDGELFDRLAAQAGLLTAPSTEAVLADRQLVEDLLGKLELLDREIIEVTFLKELDGEETARHLGITGNAARQRLHRALRRLRRSWRGGAR